MVDEVLGKAVIGDSSVIPRFDLKAEDGTVLFSNVELSLVNAVLTNGTPINKANLFDDNTQALYPDGTETVNQALSVLGADREYQSRCFGTGGSITTQSGSSTGIATVQFETKTFVGDGITDSPNDADSFVCTRGGVLSIRGLGKLVYALGASAAFYVYKNYMEVGSFPIVGSSVLSSSTYHGWCDGIVSFDVKVGDVITFKGKYSYSSSTSTTLTGKLDYCSVELFYSNA